MRRSSFAWNSLPDSLTDTDTALSLSGLQNNLKTFLFCRYTNTERVRDSLDDAAL